MAAGKDSGCDNRAIGVPFVWNKSAERARDLSEEKIRSVRFFRNALKLVCRDRTRGSGVEAASNRNCARIRPASQSGGSKLPVRFVNGVLASQGRAQYQGNEATRLRSAGGPHSRCPQ